MKVDSLRTINAMPYDPELSGDKEFWNLTKERAGIIPYLIERITDTTKTNANVPNFGGVYTIGDICVSAIAQIIKGFPTIKLIEADKRREELGYGAYWLYVRGGFKNRVEFQRRAKAWYENNKRNLVWQQDDRLYAESEAEDAVVKKRPAGGYYILKK